MVAQWDIKKRFGIIVTSLAALLSCPASHGAWAAALPTASSTTYQMNAAHTGSVKAAASFVPPLKQKWEVDLHGRLTYPIVVGNRVFITVTNPNGNGTELFALDVTTGKTLWKQAIPSVYGLSFAAYGEGILVDINSDGVLTGYDPATGDVIWSIPQLEQAGFFTSPPVFAEGSVYLSCGCSGNPEVLKINPANGNVDATFATGSTPSLPAISRGRLLAGSGCDTFLFDASTGTQIWHTNNNCSDGPEGAAAYDLGHGFATYYGGSSVTGVLKWLTGKIEFQMANTPAAFDGNLAFQSNVMLTATDLTTADIVWTFSPPDRISVPPLIINHVVYALSAAGNLYALSAGTGQLLQTMTPGAGKFPPMGVVNFAGLGADATTLIVPSAGIVAAYGP